MCHAGTCRHSEWQPSGSQYPCNCSQSLLGPRNELLRILLKIWEGLLVHSGDQRVISREMACFSSLPCLPGRVSQAYLPLYTLH